MPARDLAPEATAPVQAPAQLEPAPASTPWVPPSSNEPSRTAPAARDGAALAPARWVEGVVLFPPGTPLDEQAFVVARDAFRRDETLADGAEARAKVAADGRFRVAFAERSKSGWLALEARYSFLEQNYRWRANAATPIRLEPKLGGRIEGKLVPPAGATGAVGGSLQLSPSSWSDESFLGKPKMVAPGRDLAFAFDALKPARTYHIEYMGEAFIASAKEIQTEAGKVSAVELALERACTLVGRVVDETGAPVAGAQLGARSRSSSLSPMATSARDGTFRVQGVAAGAVQLRAELEEHLPAETDLADLVAGEERTGIELVLSHGDSIAGRVTWPDGSPAVASLVFEPETVNAPSAPTHGATTSGADGRFHVAGLRLGQYRVRAEARHGPEGAAGRKLWKALSEHVSAGSGELALVLDEGLTLHGRVVDERGAPLAAFHLSAALLFEADAYAFDSRDGVEDDFDAPDGTFHLEGLLPGSWSLTVESKDHTTPPPTRVELPAPGPLTLVVPRGALVRGRVLAPDGQAVAGAEIVAANAQGHSTADGSFSVSGITGGRVTMSARAQGWAPSASLELELGPAEERDEVVLHLRRGGRIDARVLDREGKPRPGIELMLVGASSTFQHGTTDESGRASFEGVAPGEVNIGLMEEADLPLRKKLTIGDGETVAVLLQPPDVVVKLHGHVYAGGSALAGAWIKSQRSDTHEDGPSNVAGDDGSYALDLPGSGSYWIGAWNGATNFWTTVEVPAVPELALDLSFPLGWISGRVRDADGRPLPGIRVEAKQSSDESRSSGYGTASSDADGNYELSVPPATYTLSAGGDGGSEDKTHSYALVEVKQLVIAPGTRLPGVDLTLSEGGTVEGSVLQADGTLAPFAELWIGPAHAVAHSDWLGKADERGHFHFEGVAKGEWVVTAMLGTQKAEWLGVDMKPGAVHTLQFHLEAAAWLGVRVVDRSGAPLAADVTVEDPKLPKPLRCVLEDDHIAWTGPLPAGTYHVVATLGARKAETSVTINGTQGKMTVDLVLD